MPREFAFLILTMPIAIIALVVLATAFFTGLGLIAIVVGIFIVVASLYAARGFGTLELVRLGGRAGPGSLVPFGSAATATRASGARCWRRSSTATTGSTCCTA